MKRAIIDADGHVIERDEQIKPYLDEPYRSHPDLLNVPFFPTLDGWNRAARRIADGKGKGMPAPDAKAWLGFLDAAGVEATVLFPTNGLAFGLIKDREWAAVLARGYNTFLQEEFLKAAPTRLKGIALIPLQDIGEAVMEAGAGWVPFMLERLDREAKNRGAGLRSLPSEELRSDRIFFHCELDERMLPVAVDALSAGQFFCASDFPHEPTHEFLESVTAFQTRTDLSDAVKARIMYDNAKRLYRDRKS